MKLQQLLIRPQTTIPSLVATDSATALPIIAFSCASFSEILLIAPQYLRSWEAPAIIGICALFAVSVGWAIWAFVYGGAFYLAARAFRGRRGFFPAVRAAGYALFWPGVLSIAAAVLVLGLDGPTALVDCEFGPIPLMLRLVATFWGAYSVVTAMRGWHGFSWPRAIGTYLCGMLAVILLSFVFSFLAVFWRPSSSTQQLSRPGFGPAAELPGAAQVKMLHGFGTRNWPRS